MPQMIDWFQWHNLSRTILFSEVRELYTIYIPNYIFCIEVQQSGVRIQSYWIQMFKHIWLIKWDPNNYFHKRSE